METSYRLLDTNDCHEISNSPRIEASKRRYTFRLLVIVNILLVASLATILFRDLSRLRGEKQPDNFSKSSVHKLSLFFVSSLNRN